MEDVRKVQYPLAVDREITINTFDHFSEHYCSFQKRQEQATSPVQERPSPLLSATSKLYVRGSNWHHQQQNQAYLA